MPQGNVKWRDAMLMSLADESFYNFRESCVFIKGRMALQSRTLSIAT